jgi:hypothetical protein
VICGGKACPAPSPLRIADDVRKDSVEIEINR